MPVMMETCYKGRESAGSGRLRDSSPPSRRSPRHITSGDKVHYKDNKDSRGSHDSGLDNCRDRHSSSSSSAVKNTEKHRAEVLKTALRACADWTEHLSSSGKIYYYNCKTEVSRWDKPKEWGTEAGVVVLNNSKQSQKPVEKSNNSSVKKNDGRHSVNDDHGDMRGGRVDNKAGFGSSSALPMRNSHSGAKSTSVNCVPPSSSSSHYSRTNSSASNDNFNRHRDGGGDRLNDIPRRYESSRPWDGNSPRTYRADITSSSSRGERLPERDSRREGSATPDTPLADRNSVSHSSSRPSGDYHDRTPGGSSLKRKYEEPAEDMDMDISPDCTPTEEAVLRSSSSSTLITTSINNGTNGPPTTLVSHHSLPPGVGMVPPPTAPGQVLDRQLITQQTIQTLQQFLDIQHKRQAHQLQEKMQTEQRQQQQKELLHQLNKGLDETESIPSPPSPTESEGTPLDSPVDQGLATSRGDSERKSSMSEASQPASIRGVKVVSALANQLGGRRHDPVQLTPTLINYFNEKLIGHTLGWITDGAEKQIQRVGEESHIISSRHCSRISVELKRSRSLVRIAEIQANIKEQRVLFLQQHLKDLESGRSNLIAPDGT